MDVLEIRSRLADSALVRDVDVVPRGHVRLETAFVFPEGSSLDLYVVARTEGAESGCLSDLGETLDWLLDVEVNPQESPRQKKLLEDVLRSAGVTLHRGALELPLPSIRELPDCIVRLGQTCLRVADLIYTAGDAAASRGPA